MNTTLQERYLAVKRALFRRVYEERLNPPQAQAVFQTEGPLLVLAGAGSGKTTVLVRRIAFIIRYGNAYHSEEVPTAVDEGMVEHLEQALATYTPDAIRTEILPTFIARPCPPWAILAITFTNKAAKEMKERLATELEDESISGAITAGTFHAVCVRMLHRYGGLVGYPDNFTIYDTDDTKRLITDLMKDMGIDEKILPVKTVCARISKLKEGLTPPDAFRPDPKKPREYDIAKIYKRYQERLLALGALDFDDIIMKTVELLENHEEVRVYYQNKFRYVCVDEYQDTNPAQFRLTQLLSAGHGNIMVVGDDDQSIYAFRGATIENILSFDTTYQDCRVIRLEQNYRSTKRILAAANGIIAHNNDRHEKTLWCDTKEGEPIHLRLCGDQRDEARYIVDTITDQVVMHGRRYQDFAILYRVNEQARALESAFAKSGIPYRVLGGVRFYDRKEIRDIAAYLHIVINPRDDQRVKRVINMPRRGIGDTAVAAAEAIALAEGKSLFDVLAGADKYVALSRYATKFYPFVELIRRWQGLEITPAQLIETIFEESGYHAMLEAEGEVSKTRIDAIKEFISAAVEYEGRLEEGAVPSLRGFMEEVALVADVDKYDEEANAVVLMTIHSAKGLEFPVVFLPGMEENLFPSPRSDSEGELSEERRLAYVAVTRAKEAIYITHTSERMLYGRTGSNRISRFVLEIPQDLIKKEGAARTFAPPSGGYTPRYGQSTGQSTRSYPSYQETRPSRPGFDSSGAWRSDTATAAKKSPASYGVSKFAPGTRVKHPVFGIGTVLEARDMGGDVLYQVAFDNGDTKKLMATFAKLQKL